jgi:iron complex transport system substrate-binding protein
MGETALRESRRAFRAPAFPAAALWRAKARARVAVASAACAALFACAPAVGATVVDDRGVTIDFATAPKRIVTLAPSLTELVCELGACSRLVGVDTFSNWPASVQALPRMGGLEDANVEAIVALKPDVVVLTVSARVLGRLESLGIKVVALETKTTAHTKNVLRKLAAVVGGDADKAWQRIDGGVRAAADSLPAHLRGSRVYFEVNSGPYAAGEASFIGELMTRLGLVNVVPASLGPFPKLNPEFVVRADPQVIMISARHGDTVGARPGWSRIAAVRDGRVCRFTPEQGDVLVRPGPRMPLAAQLMVQCVTGRLQVRP